MRRIAYLACPTTMPGSADRRKDAYEHDLEFEALSKSAALRDMAFECVSWDDDRTDWAAFDAAIIRTTWDYQTRMADFLSALDRIEAAGAPVFNSPSIVKWNINKLYLLELEKKGIAIPPTLAADGLTGEEGAQKHQIATWQKELASKKLVIKQQVGAGAHHQYLVEEDTQLPELKTPVLIQPFLPSIQSFGEISFLFIGGKFSHALLKTTQKGDYRIQSLYGGKEQVYHPDKQQLTCAQNALEAIEADLLYARIDMVSDGKGGWLLMEMELIEPYLYPEQGPKLGGLFAEALHSRLNR